MAGSEPSGLKDMGKWPTQATSGGTEPKELNDPESDLRWFPLEPASLPGLKNPVLESTREQRSLCLHRSYNGELLCLCLSNLVTFPLLRAGICSFAAFCTDPNFIF